MENSRRDFLKKAALLASGAGIWSALPVSIEKALAIAPDHGTTFYDAEHVVLLMQENRSFDHSFGTLKGVRGFNDPFAISLPDKNPVWYQPDRNGLRFVPFRLDIEHTKATWMGGLPHSWENQVDARNEGKHNGWIEAKKPGKTFHNLPLTMGYYNRQDIPFYYELADAFTICDQHFCASLTGTTTNRTYFWTGKTHGKTGDRAKVRNDELTYDKQADWTTFPERLEALGVSWKVYQNEISLPTNVEDDSLLANFTDNNLEWFAQYHVRFSRAFHDYLQKAVKTLPEKIAALEKQLAGGDNRQDKLQRQIEDDKRDLTEARQLLEDWAPEKFSLLPETARQLHQKAFTTNSGDADYHRIEEMTYWDKDKKRTTKVPRGDVLYQFRKDVKEGKLPTVSWLVAPEKFSDHPGAPWYGAWYVSAIMDILTQNPAIWKKTIFILNYDENDGYFDHIPPFVAPRPGDGESGKMSEGLDATGEYVTREEELKAGFAEQEARTSPVGLGYRVPLIIASPWSRGGWVNSEVFDITSVIQFLEKFLSKKTRKQVEEPNISSWRRAITGDLTSAFRPYKGERIGLPEWLDRNKHIQEIFNAKFRKIPNNFRALSAEQARALGQQPHAAVLPKQEPGTKPSNALKYELYVSGTVQRAEKNFAIQFQAAQEIFGKEALGAPFNVYAPDNYLNKETLAFEPVRTWSFAVKSGDILDYSWPLEAFEGDSYHLRVYGPNGFFREFEGRKDHGGVMVHMQPLRNGRKVTRECLVTVKNLHTAPCRLNFVIRKYENRDESFQLNPGEEKVLTLHTGASQGWYDFLVQNQQADGRWVRNRYAGRLETGANSISDPYMGSI